MLYKYMNSLKHYERLMCVWPKFNYRIKVDSLGKRLLHLLYFRETLVKTCSGENLLESFRKMIRKRPPCSQVLLKLLTILKMQIFSQTIFLFVCVFLCPSTSRVSPVQNDVRGMHKDTGQRCSVEKSAGMPLPIFLISVS